MKEIIVTLRNSMHRLFYKLAKLVMFRIDPEKTHDSAIRLARFAGSNKLTQFLTRVLFGYSHPALQQTVCGINFPNPIGLAAGFDKNAQLTQLLPHMGFGFVEVGSVTGEACEGNPKPRLWRLKKSKSLLVYYGLKNHGCEVIAKRLEGKQFKIPIGISVAKTNCKETVETQAGIRDYVKAHQAFADLGSYTTINISCPNAFGGEPFTDEKKLHALLKEMRSVSTYKPIFLKLSPDLSKEKLDLLIDIARKYGIAGFICSNLTKNRNNPAIKDEDVPSKGGIGGKAEEALTTAQIAYVYKKLQERKSSMIVIGCGGVSSAEDAYKKIKAGASLIQLITGMIYEGPQVISEINQGLVKLLKKDGYENISEAVGTS